MSKRTVAVLLAAAVVVAGCGYDPPSDLASAEPTVASAPATTSTTSTSLPPGGRQPDRDDPLRVLLAGDSVMADLAPPVIDALERGGAGDARFFLSPGVSLSAAADVLWRQQLVTFDPEVIVVLVGTWETAGDLGTPGADGWREQYDAKILDPFVELVTGDGAELLWVGMPAVMEGEATFQLAALNDAYQALTERYAGDVDYIPGGEYVSSPDGGYAEFLEGDDGTERVRRIDGLHLCPPGAARIAQPVIDNLVERWNIPVADDWQSGEWTRPPLLLKPEECPAV